MRGHLMLKFWAKATPKVGHTYEPPHSNKKRRGTHVIMPTIKTVYLMPTMQQDHCKYLRFKRMK